MLDENEFSEHESESATWIALADLMTGLMAIFLVMCMIIMTNQDRTRILIIQSISEIAKQKNINIKVDQQTGDISITDSILFDLNKSTLNEEGRNFLTRFVPIYSQVLFEKLPSEQSKQVSRIIVEGHTLLSPTGQYAPNMQLSLNRAYAVAAFVESMPDFSHKDEFLKKLTPVGRGYLDSKPYNHPEDRKVIFTFQFSSKLNQQELISNS